MKALQIEEHKEKLQFWSDSGGPPAAQALWGNLYLLFLCSSGLQRRIRVEECWGDLKNMKFLFAVDAINKTIETEFTHSMSSVLK